MSRKSKRVVALGDLHCGHLAGLTPPQWHAQHGHGEKWAALQAECWRWYTQTIHSLRPIDIVFANADLIDGNGAKSAGTELITTDRKKQIDMAVEALLFTGAKQFVLTFGTGYHTGNEEDWESLAADALECKIGSHEWPRVNGLTFDLKHHLGSSSVPHGRHTAIARDRLWNLLWAEREEQPVAQVYIRSHVHYHQFTGGPGWLAMTLPALQAASTKYGSRRCSGVVDYGMVHFDITPTGNYSWQAHLARLRSQKAQTTDL